MCGIAAILAAAPDPALPAQMAGMLARLAHRGPDDAAEWFAPDGRAALGQTRLSIVDLSPRGRQPMANEDGTLWLTFNGEIYNWRPLRAELEARGHRFRSDTDSEVLLHLFEEEGEAMLARLRGMFAFVLYDTRTARAFCARDRVGKKPLVYAEIVPEGGGEGAIVAGARVAIASEIPALWRQPGLHRGVSAEGLALYLLRHLRHVPDPWTLWRGLRRLPPAHAMTIAEGRIERIWCYWEPRFDPLETVSADAFLSRFDEAVDLRRLADVEVAALLSGGVDSSAVVQAMGALGSRGIRSYVLGRDAADDELPRARRAAELFATTHREVLFDAETHHDGFVELIARHGEPIALLPLVHAFRLCQAIRADGVKVVMTGHGADEVFFGYSGHLGQAAASRAAQSLPPFMRPIVRTLAGLMPGLPDQARHGALVLGHAPGDRRAALYRSEAERLWPTILRPEARPDPAALIGAWLSVMPGAAPPAAYIDEAMVIALLSENAPSVTIAGDLPAMAAGVETRAPFLDHELLEYAFRIPWQAKLGAAKGPGDLKRFLKGALRGRLPEEILTAEKRGFGFNIQEAELLRGAWRGRVEAAFAAFDDLDGMIEPAAAERALAGLDGPPEVARSAGQTVLKLYALQLALGMAKEAA